MEFKELEKKIGYKFKKLELLQEALTHRSYLNENPKWPLSNNERLEFLGDAVLELAVTEELFNRFPESQEGWMTSVRAALVNYVIMAKIAGELGLDKYILMSRGEAKDTGRAREVILANALEGLIGAVYLDKDYKAAKALIGEFVLCHLADVLKNHLFIDAKSQLQEKVQAQKKITPTYRVLESEGPDHKKVFKVGVYFGDKLMAEGRGMSKQDAEVEAAKKALEGLE